MTNRQTAFVAILFVSTLVLGLSLLLAPWQSQDDAIPTLAQLPEQVSATQQAQTVNDLVTLPVGEELIVQFRDTPSDVELQSVVAQLDAQLSRALPNMRGAVIVKSEPITPEQLSQLPANVIVEPNYKVQSLLTFPSNDPMITDQWSFDAMDVDELWTSVDNNQTIVAVIDSGACFDHPDLQGRYLNGGYDYIDDDTNPSDEMGHGCAVSGIITANVDNGIGIAGIAPNTSLLPLRVLDANGVGTYADVISAIYEAVSSGADIINLSLGGQNHSQMLEQAVNYAIDNGVDVVAGTGNTGTQGVFYPAKYPNVIAVGSHDVNGTRSSFSTYGNEIDTLAPGEDILTTTINGDYGYFSGTSMAVPHVTGLLALSRTSGQPADLANIMSTPEPLNNGNQVEAQSTFSCNSLSIVFHNGGFTDNRVLISIINYDSQPTYLLNSEVHWDKSPAQSEFPNINLSAMAFDSGTYWVGSDQSSPTTSNLEGTLLYDPAMTTHDIYVPASSYVVWSAQFTNGPAYLHNYFTIYDFLGTNFTLDHPDPDEEDCVIPVRVPPTMTSTPVDTIHTLTPSPSSTPDMLPEEPPFPECATTDIELLDIGHSTVFYQVQNVATATDYLVDISYAYDSPLVPVTATNSLLGVQYNGSTIWVDQPSGGTDTIGEGIWLSSPYLDGGLLTINHDNDFDMRDYYQPSDLNAAFHVYSDVADSYCTIYPTVSAYYEPPIPSCDNYADVYTLGTAQTNLESDLQRAVECANQSTANNTIDLNGAIITYFDAPVEYDVHGHNALQPITSTSIGGTLTIQNGAIQRDESLACDPATDSTDEFRFLYIHDNADVTLSNLTLDNGCASESAQAMPSYDGVKVLGGAIYNNGQLQINNSTLTNNSALANVSATETGLGGAIFTIEGTVTVTNSTISDNISDGGGGIFAGLGNPSDVNIIESIFSRNESPNGGGIHVLYGNLQITDSTFDANRSTTASGGAIAMAGTSMTITTSVFHNNYAEVSGGALNFYNVDNAIIDSSLFYNNTANTYGGAISADSLSTTITNTTITENQATDLGGGLLNAGNLDLYNSTIANNSASNGSEVWTEINTATQFINTILANTSGTDLCAGLGTTITYSGLNLIQDGSCDADTNGQLTGDPLLSLLQDNGGATLTMALLPDSPAIDAGNNDYVDGSIGDLVEFDQRGTGYQRIQNTIVDLGAYETDPAFTPDDFQCENLNVYTEFIDGNVMAFHLTNSNAIPTELTAVNLEFVNLQDEVGLYLDGLSFSNPDIQTNNPLIWRGDMTSISPLYIDSMVPSPIGINNWSQANLTISAHSTSQIATSFLASLGSENLSNVSFDGTVFTVANPSTSGTCDITIPDDVVNPPTPTPTSTPDMLPEEPPFPECATTGIELVDIGHSSVSYQVEDVATATDYLVDISYNYYSPLVPVTATNSLLGVQYNSSTIWVDQPSGGSDTIEEGIWLSSPYLDGGLLTINHDNDFDMRDYYQPSDLNAAFHVYSDVADSYCTIYPTISDYLLPPTIYPVQNLTANASDNGIELSWNISGTTEGVDIYRRISGTDSDFEYIDTVTDSFTTYTDQSRPACDIVVDYRAINRVYYPYQNSYYYADPTDVTYLNPCPRTDLALDISVNATSLEVFETVVYTVSVINEGNETAHDIDIRVIEPDSYHRYGISDNISGTFDEDEKLWTISELEEQASASLTFTAYADSSSTSIPMVMTAELVDTDAIDPDSTPNNGIITEDDYDTASVSLTCSVADVFNVTNGDTNGFVKAIGAANLEDCFPGQDTITLASYGLYEFDERYDGATLNRPYEHYLALPPITSDIVIQGNHAQVTSTDEDYLHTILIENTGSLTLEQTIISNFEGAQLPATVYNQGELSIHESTFEYNDATYDILLDEGTSPTTITHSYFANNYKPVSISSNGAVITNNTFAYNTHGSGTLEVDNYAMVTFNTFYMNTGHAIIARLPGDLTPIQVNLLGNLLFNPDRSRLCRNDGYSSTLNSLGYNISTGFENDCDFDQSTDKDYQILMSMPAPLNNGGGTLTSLPPSDSILVDYVPPEDCTVSTDQRGFARPHNTNCDVGAVERTNPLPAPSDLTVTPISGTTDVLLEWTNNTTEEELNEILFSTSTDSNWYVLDQVQLNGDSYIHSDLNCLQSYNYQVRAINSSTGRYSDSTNIVENITVGCVPLEPPTLNITAITGTKIPDVQFELSWIDTNDDEDGYEVEFIEQGGEWVSLTSTAETTLVQDLRCEWDYQYRVRSTRSADGDVSDWSNILSFTAGECPSPPTLTSITATYPTTQDWLIRLDFASYPIAGSDTYLAYRRTDETESWNYVLSPYPTDSLTSLSFSVDCEVEYVFRMRVRILVGSQYQFSDYAYWNETARECIELTAPTAITATNIEPFSVTLNWSDTSIGTGNEAIIERQYQNSGWGEVGRVPISQTTFTDLTVLCQQSYDYRVRIYNSNLAVSGHNYGYSMPSNNITVDTANCIIDAPTSLMADNITDSSLRVTWQDNSPIETSYELWRSRDNMNWSHRASLPSNTLEYTDSFLDCDGIYYYRLNDYSNTYNIQSSYEFTSATTAKCEVELPDNVSSTTIENRASLSWEPVSTRKTTQVIIERSGQPVGALSALNDDWQVIATLPGNAGIFTDNDIRCGMNYAYRMTGYNATYNEYTAPGNTVQITTWDCPVPVTNTVGLYSQGTWMFREGFDDDSPVILFQFGPNTVGWTPITGDWDGDGIDGIGLYKEGLFALRDVSEAGVVDYVYRFGPSTDDWQPIVGDWNGDGTDTVGVYRNGRFRLSDSHEDPQVDYEFIFGMNEDGWTALAGDWNQDGRDLVGVYKEGLFLLQRSFQSRPIGSSLRFGPNATGWQAVSGDWDEDGISTIGLFQRGNWRLRNTNTAGTPDIGFIFGTNEDGWYPIASYRGDAEAVEQLAALSTIPLSLDPENRPIEATATATTEIEPTIPTETLTVTVVTSPTTSTTSETQPTVTLTPSLVPSFTATATTEPTETASPTEQPTDTIEPPATLEPTATDIPPTLEPTKSDIEPEATEEAESGE